MRIFFILGFNNCIKVLKRVLRFGKEKVKFLLVIEDVF